MSRENKKPIIILSTLLVFVTVMLVLVFISYIGFLREHLVHDEVTYINELALQSTNSIRNRVIAESNVVKYAANIIDPNNKDSALEYLNEICEQYEFGYMGFADMNGIGYFTAGDEKDCKHDLFFTHSASGADYISDPFRTDEFPNAICILYSSPVTDADGNVLGVVFAVSPNALYTGILNSSIPGDSETIYLATSAGEILASSAENISGITDITDICPDDSVNMQILKNNVAVLNSGFSLVGARNEKQYIFYAPLVSSYQSTDEASIPGASSDVEWALLLSVPYKIIYSKINYILGYTICVCTALFLLFVALAALSLSTQRESRRKLEHLAYHDPVTKGRNFNKFKIDAERLLAKSKHKNYAIITLDVNRFKYINDLYGYDEGTRILKNIYSITDASSAHGSELVCRMGNDKFVFLFVYTDKPTLEERIEELCYDISAKNEYNFVFSVGIYEISDRKMSVDSMIDRAMIALKSVKNTHQTAYAFYDEKIRNEILRERSIENDMHDSLRNGEFEIFYQPKYFIDNATLAGAEALVRWNHHEHGFMPPCDFIPLFEKSDFIIKLDHYVFEQTCKNMRRWLEQGKQLVTISINFSRVHLNTPNCLDYYEKYIKKYAIPPKYIEFEFTESAIFENSSTLIKILDRIHSMGCTVSMDDFGTGYSSLNMLKEVPVDVLKLDKEFFSDSSDSKRAKDIVETVVQLAKKLNIHVVAEGVEEQEQLEFLHNINCDVAQGYYFSKPIPTSEFEKLLVQSA
ncbi:MAG: EAL domain-containing protein [Oscillospiraceae bacterium]|nr:EAL domain-containing protein [Oscillospiraceae bacterium]